MKCLYCSKEIEKFYEDYYQCSCGIKYSLEIINEFNKKEWNHIRRWRLFKVVNNKNEKQLIMYSIVKLGKKAKVVHPLHYDIYYFLVKRGWIKNGIYYEAS